MPGVTGPLQKLFAQMDNSAICAHKEACPKGNKGKLHRDFA